MTDRPRGNTGSFRNARRSGDATRHPAGERSRILLISAGRLVSAGQSRRTLYSQRFGACRVGRPVKLVVPRAQVFHATSFRAPTEHKITFGADTDGRFVGGIHLVRALTSRFDLMPFTGQESTSVCTTGRHFAAPRR